METKNVGKFKINYKTKPNPDDINTNLFTFTISEPLQKMIKTACVDGETGYEFRNGDGYSNRKRFLVKGCIFRELDYDSRDYLFDKELADEGKFEIAFSSLTARDNFLKGLIVSIKKLTSCIGREVLDETVTFLVRSSE